MNEGFRDFEHAGWTDPEVKAQLGASFTFTCGDASAQVAVWRAADAIRAGRVDVAWAGGIDLMVPPLVRVLALMGIPFLGEGAACFVLEEAEAARRKSKGPNPCVRC